MPISKKYRNNPEIRKALADAWLNIRVDEESLGNPLAIPPEFADKPEKYIMWVMSQPDYFYFVCKEILNIELSPTQCVVLKELWQRKFPMYIATRGFGKALLPDTPVRIKNGWVPIKDLAPGDKVYGGDGQLCNVTNVTHLQKDLEFYKITFQDGRSIDCCKDHQWRVWDVTRREWVVRKTSELFNNYYWTKHKEGRKNPHREYRYAIPISPALCDEDLPPLFSPAGDILLDGVKSFESAKESFSFIFDDMIKAYRAANIIRSHGYYVEHNGLNKRVKVYGWHPFEPTTAAGKAKQDKVFICDIKYLGKRDGMCIMVDSPDNTYIVQDYIVTHNSFLLGVYAILRLLFIPKRKVVIAGAAFRQSKIIFEYMEAIYNNAPLLRDLFKGGRNGPRHENDMYRFYFNESVVIAIPIGNGEKIRGLRAHDLLVDEFNSISRELFETVLVGFTAVSSNPIANQKAAAAEALAKKMGWWEDDFFDDVVKDNQLIISGTAGYSFQHFYKYWKDWHDIITSQGDEKKLEDYFKRRSADSGMEADDIARQLDYRNYSIIRIPIKLIPPGVMDIGAVSRARATMHSGTYQNEYGAVFSDDSNGFFKRSLIEYCTVEQNEENYFEPTLFGDLSKRYVYGVDPASEVDKFAIVVLELWNNHRRVVYSWTTNKVQHRDEVKKGLSKEQDYYSYCARKIRNLMRRFPCERIMMDSQGGGYAIMEQFRDPENLQQGEHILLPVIDPKKPQDTDMMDGINLVELVNFRDNQWTSEANHGMRLDFETRVLLFPYYDALVIAKAGYFDENTSHIYDSLEDCAMDIQELKDELANIIMSATPSGQDKWDTPEEIQPGGKKGRIRKDRYSALVMANMGARIIQTSDFNDTFESMGGWSGKSKETGGSMYTSPFYSQWADEFYNNY